MTIEQIEDAAKLHIDKRCDVCPLGGTNKGFQACTDELLEELRLYVMLLKSENAALRERLEEAVNKRVVANMLAKYFDCPCNFSPIDEEMYEFCDSCAMNDVDCWEKVIEKNIAEARLAELKGEKNE